MNLATVGDSRGSDSVLVDGGSGDAWECEGHIGVDAEIIVDGKVDGDDDDK